MKTTWVIFKKELLDTLRDRRTLLMAIVLPLMLFPVIIGVFVELQSSQTQKAEERVLRVGLVTEGNAESFADMLRSRPDLRLYDDIPADSARAFVRNDSLDAVFQFGANFDERVDSERAGNLSLVYESGGDVEVQQRRLRALVDRYRAHLMDERLARLNLSATAMETIHLTEIDVATQREAIGRLIGGFLPYVFLAFCFLGAMYPAIDLGAGEKERHTMETLLTSPVSRFQIVLGKFLVITLAGVVGAFVSILGLYVGLLLIDEIPAELIDVAQSVLEPGAVLLELSLLIPLTMFFAGLQLTLSLYAKSFKEAQSILSPLSILVFLPAIIGLLPGMELSFGTALIPVLNVSLATKDIIAGTVDPGLLALVYLSLIVLAGIGLALCTFYFRRENIIFRT